MRLRFWGTRGSIPTPLKPQEIEEKLCRAILTLPDMDLHDEAAVRAYVAQLPPLLRGTAGGNTPCVELRAGELVFALDAGTGLREMGKELLKGPLGRGAGTLHLFVSHPHWDHIQGFTMFTPAFIPGNRIVIYGVHDLRAAFTAQQDLRYWPVSLAEMGAQIEFVTLTVGEPLWVGPVRVDLLKNVHRGDAYSFRFTDAHNTVVYSTDAEYKQLEEASLRPYVEFFRDADVLVFDAAYTLRDAWEKVDWGHSSALIGVDLARAAGVKRLVLFHHDPAYSDTELAQMQETAVAYQAQDPHRPTCEILIGCEGLTLDLTPAGAVDVQLTSNGEMAILTPAQIFDELVVDRLAQQLAASRRTPILDLSQVETLTTAGLQALVRWQKERRDTNLVLIVPSDRVQQVIRLSGYQDSFVIYPTLPEALAAIQAREMARLPGQVIQGRYQIEKWLDESWLGATFRAIDLQQHKTVALKVLSPALSLETRHALMQQSRRIMALDHPHIVKVLDWSMDQGAICKAEEFILAPTLKQRLAAPDPLLSGEQALDIAMQVAQALEYAHSRGVVHGTLRPSEILLTAEGVKLNGFGLSPLIEGRVLLNAPQLYISAAYLAPEQILGQPIDARTDLYALGVILYQMLTGHLPFAGDDEAIMQAHLSQTPRPPSELNPQISPSLEHLVLKLLAKNPNDRYASSQQARRISSSLLAWTDEAALPSLRSLVGRESELQALQACWGKASAGEGQLVFITGEAGIGKTTLVRQLAAQSGAAVLLVGQSSELDHRAYALWSQILQAYLATVPPECSDESERQWLGNLLTLVPELRQMLPDLTVSPPLEPAQEQLRLMGSVTRFIQQATQRRPWLVILENLQWADHQSLDLLCYLGRHLPEMALLLVGTYRDTELATGHPLWDTLRTLSRHPTYRQFSLERLGEAGVERLLAEAWQQPVPPALVARIYQHTAGNPFYVEEVARGLVEEGIITPQGGRWQFPELPTIALPPGVREAVWRRINLLTPDTQGLLRQAAVLGQTFSFDDLREMSNLPEWEALERLDLALERHLVEEVPGDGLLSFRQAEIQQVLYADLGPLRRRLLHRQAGEALERRAKEPGGRAAELAHHFAEAGETEKAIRYGLLAAQQNQAIHANEAALVGYTQLLALVEQLPQPQREQFWPQERLLHRSLCEVLTRLGRYDEALVHCTTAQTMAAVAASPEESVYQAGICYQLAEIHQCHSEYAQALEWVQKGLQFLAEAPPSCELARLYTLAGSVSMRQGRYPEARTWLDKALAMAQTMQQPQVEADSLRLLGMVTWYAANDVATAQDYFERALALYQQIGERQGESHSLNNLGVMAISQNKDEVARAYYERALSIYREIGDRAGIGFVLNNLGVIAWHQSRYVEARTYFEQALQLRREVGDRRGEALALANLGTMAMQYGDYPQATVYLEQALALTREIGDRAGEAATLSALSTLFNHQERYAQALPSAWQALALLQELGQSLEQAETLIQLAQAQVGLGQPHEAAAAYQQVLALAGPPDFVPSMVHAHAGLARLALAQDDLVQARRHVQEVLPYLSEKALRNSDEPEQVYWTCYCVLRASQDPAAETLLQAAYSEVQAQATGITEAALRRSFLENVAARRAIVQAFEADGQLKPAHESKTTG